MLKAVKKINEGEVMECLGEGQGCSFRQGGQWDFTEKEVFEMTLEGAGSSKGPEGRKQPVAVEQSE